MPLWPCQTAPYTVSEYSRPGEKIGSVKWTLPRQLMPVRCTLCTERGGRPLVLSSLRGLRRDTVAAKCEELCSRERFHEDQLQAGLGFPLGLDISYDYLKRLF